jgi:hypothetical protein
VQFGHGCSPLLRLCALSHVLTLTNKQCHVSSHSHVYGAYRMPHLRTQGMAAGENTLNALCARVVMRGIAANGG